VAKVVMRSNDCYQEVWVNGKRIIGDDGINRNELLSLLGRELGFEYVHEDGDWDKNDNWKPKKR
jgi:hypothetical protein